MFYPGQVISRACGAQCTPHVYILNKTPEENRVAYIGVINNNTEDTKADKIKYVEQAADALLVGVNLPRK